MKNKAPLHIKTISEFHKLRGLPKPEHPLISVVDYELIKYDQNRHPDSWSLDFYCISLKRTTNAKIKYGQQQYDFDNGVLFFMAPGQVFRITHEPGLVPEHTGWILLIHPDFFWSTPLAKAIKKFEFFDYAVNEALFLSGREEEILNNIIQNIVREYHSNIDEFSQDIVVTQIETLLNYSQRYYRRQFITRKITNHHILDKLEILLTDHFNNTDLSAAGLPTVQFIADELHVSPNYLSSLLRVLTGKSTQHHIHDKLIEKAKEKLSTTGLNVNQIAFELGFEYPQSFTKLFKMKTNVTPVKFRQSFN